MTVSKRMATRWTHVLPVALTFAIGLPPSLHAQGRGLPDGAGRDIVQRVCGSTCHGAELVAGKGYTRDSWGAVVNSMVSRGAKASDTELAAIVDYLAANLPPKTGKAGAGGAGFLGGGSDEAQLVDVSAAERGRTVYIAECITCHGVKGRGGPRGADLIRSMIVLKDRYGSMIGGFLKAGHPMQSGKPSSSLTGPQIVELSHFLHEKVADTLRNGPYSKPLNVLTGNATDGAAYFNGAGGCNQCHSVTGDLAGVGTKYDPVSLQQKFLFPRTFATARGGSRTRKEATVVTVTVTPPSGPSVTGVLEHLDDFNVSLRDSEGNYFTWKRTPSLQVVKHDPLAMHEKLLDRYTDKNMHDIVAYLETLK